MWRKSAVRRLADWVPQSPELVELLQRENEAGESELPDVDWEGEVISETEDPETPDTSADETPADRPAPASEQPRADDWPPVNKPGSGVIPGGD